MKFKRYNLKNGITLLYEKRDLPLVSFSISNRFGASFESAEIKGIAHFIEHLLFTGTKTRTHEDISREIEKKGGIINAFTSHDVTSYWFKLPSEHLFAGMDIITDMLNNSIFDKEKFEKEKKVILEEIKMYHDMPQRHIYDKMLQNMYESPFGLGVVGSKETINRMNRDFVADYFSKHYSPENFIACIVGQADIKEVCAYLEKKFKKSRSMPSAKKVMRKNGESIEERDGLDQAHFLFGVHSPTAGDRENYVLHILDAYLANGMSSRLFLEIREKRGLAYAVSSSAEAEKSYSHYTIYVGTTKEAIPEVKKLILQGFKDIDKMTEKDLKEAKEMLIGLKKVSSEESVSVMNSLIFSEIATKAEDFYTYEKEINAIRLDEVKKLAKRLIKSYSTAAIVPK